MTSFFFCDYLFSAVGAAPWIKEVRKANSPPALGASAAVNGIVMLSILLYPRRMVYLYAVLPVPAALLGVLYIGSDMLGVLGVGIAVQAQHMCSYHATSHVIVTITAYTFLHLTSFKHAFVVPETPNPTVCILGNLLLISTSLLVC